MATEDVTIDSSLVNEPSGAIDTAEDVSSEVAVTPELKHIRKSNKKRSLTESEPVEIISNADVVEMISNTEIEAPAEHGSDTQVNACASSEDVTSCENSISKRLKPASEEPVEDVDTSTAAKDGDKLDANPDGEAAASSEGLRSDVEATPVELAKPSSVDEQQIQLWIKVVVWELGAMIL